MPRQDTRARIRAGHERGFTLVELLVALAITTLVLGTTMVAMSDAVKASDTARLMTGLNNNLRTAMDLIVRDMLQVGQGLPAGRAVVLPSGTQALNMRIPGPPGTDYELTGTNWCPPSDFICRQVPAVLPGPARGPEVTPDHETDTITTLAIDSSFDQVRLTAFAVDGLSMNVDPSVNITDGGADDLHAGDLIMLTKGSSSALVQVTRVSAQTVYFDTGDSLRLNQTAAAVGTPKALRDADPKDTTPVAPAVFVNTQASRVRMIGYYIDATTNPDHPRLVRRMNNGHATTFDNTLGTVVAFDIEDFQISYDLANGVTNPTNVRMTADDIAGTGACAPDPCSPNQIRKVNILLAGRSRQRMSGTNQFYRNRLFTQVSLRSLAFVDKYR